MDFASLMAKEISKAKSTSSTQKYVRKGEIEAQREAAYLEEQRQQEREKEERAAKKRKLEEEQAERDRIREKKRKEIAEESQKRREAEAIEQERAKRRRLGLPDLPEKQEEEPEEENSISPTELTAKLRELSAPKTLFGETHAQRLRRLERLTTESKRDPTQPVATSLELVPEAEMKVPETVPNNPKDIAYVYRQLASYFNLVLREWKIALAQRSEEVKESHQGKIAAQAYTESTENLKPLFRYFENAALEIGVLSPLIEIVRAAQERRYVDASNSYLRLSIGNAAWPIGVTMVGIHERSAREKLHELGKGKAHIMGDEITRRFLQSIKRCLSFAQTRWPPHDQLQLMG